MKRAPVAKKGGNKAKQGGGGGGPSGAGDDFDFKFGFSFQSPAKTIRYVLVGVVWVGGGRCLPVCMCVRAEKEEEGVKGKKKHPTQIIILTHPPPYPHTPTPS